MPDGSHPLRRFRPRRRRRILCVFPRYSHSFGTFNHAFPLMGGVRAFMPPQGILLVAALLPSEWEVRFVDENVRPVAARELAWADAVFTSGMHIQRERIGGLCARAHRAGKPVAVGGPSVSAAPEYYPEADYLHCGEAGDATLRLLERLDETAERPAAQVVFRTVDRLPLAEFPSPAYRLIDVRKYLLGSVQFSSGCPFTCEFCDIPGLYGRNPRLKSPEQVVAELDALADGGAVSVYFVDDNFIGNPKAALELLPHLVAWQKRRDYRVRLACEATLNIAGHDRILELMREAFFVSVFCGIETPEPDALRFIKKGQNLRSPILEAVRKLNRYGIEVASGIIVGLDTDTPATPRAIVDFAAASGIPILTVNLLYALPHTPLHERLKKAGRLRGDASGLDSNVEFLRPYDEVVADWKRIIGEVYAPGRLYARYRHNIEHTYPHRRRPARPWRQATPRNLLRALSIAARIAWRVGFRSAYRRHFWGMALAQLRRGEVENVLQVAMVGHHLITYADECVRGLMQSSNYSPRNVAPAKREAVV